MKFSQLIEADNNESQDEMKTRVFKIPVENIPKLEDDIAKLNKKCQKLNCPPVTIEFGEKTFEVQKQRDQDSDAEPIYIEYQLLTISGTAPKLNGWTFAGKLEQLGNETIVKAIPGMELPERYKHSPIHCEHCKKNVRRNDTFILKNEDEKFIQVGRSCLKDFLGHADPSHVAAMAEFFKDFDSKISGYEDIGRYGRTQHTYHVPELLALAFAVITRDKGFRPRSFDVSTVSGMQAHLWPQPGSKEDNRVKITEQDRKNAEDAIKWVNSKINDRSDFIQNLIKYVRIEYVPANAMGFIAALAGSFLKERDNIVHTPAAQINNDPIGPVGQKIKFTASVVSAHRYQGNPMFYGDSGIRQILTMKTENNQLVKQFTSNLDLKKGDKVNISGTIGKFEKETFEKSPYKGNMITMMAPRARMTAVNEPTSQEMAGPERLSNISSIEGNPISSEVEYITIDHSKSNQWKVALNIKEKGKSPVMKFFNRNDVTFSDS